MGKTMWARPSLHSLTQPRKGLLKDTRIGGIRNVKLEGGKVGDLEVTEPEPYLELGLELA